MIRGIHTSASGMLLKAEQQKIVANNLANVNTTGFKKDDLFLRTLIDCDPMLATRETGDPRGRRNAQEFMTDFRQGELLKTGNQLDLALDGDGFFAIETPEGESYTRAGNFALNVLGQLVTHEGHIVNGEGGPITISGTQVTVSEDGEVIVDGASAGRLKIVDFEQPYRLTRVGGGLFAPLDTENSDAMPAQNAKVVQGCLEGSNVRAIEEMVKMIEIFREYEAGQKSIKLQDETVRKAISEVGRVNSAG